jgi:hypothetical protein
VETTPPARYLAIDPGETLGYATFSETGQLLDMGQFRFEKFLEEIESLLTSDIKVCIVEDYVNYAWQKQKRWSKNNTSKIIGKIELLAQLRGVKIVLQPAANYSIGAKWGGFEIPSNHDISHQFVAAAHGIFWLQDNGIREVGQALIRKYSEE